MQQHEKAFKLLPYALCCHMIIAIFVYTCPQIYSLTAKDYTSQLDTTNTTLYEGEYLSIGERVFSFNLSLLDNISLSFA